MRPVRPRRGLLGAEAPREIANLSAVRAVEPSPRTVEPPRRATAPTPLVPQRSIAARHDLRPLNAPSALRVQLDEHGRVVAIWRNGRLAPRTIAAIQDRWRIDDEWWREHVISRMYYALLLDDGTLLTVYHDLLADEWFEQRS